MLSLDLSKFAKKSIKKQEIIARKVFIGLSTAVIKSAPVLNGELRGSIQPDLNKYDNTDDNIEDKSGRIAISRLNKKMASFKLGDTMTLSINKPYAYRIEYLNWSKIKAPQGFIRINIAQFQKWADKEARKVK